MSSEDMNANMATTENENENENNEANSNELNELRESNARLLAEKQVLEDQIKVLEDQIKALKKTLEEESRCRRRNYNWFEAEKNKVLALAIIIKAISGNIDAGTLADNIEKVL